jgi:DtxR family Mn-dependent transcriptional regulator
MEIHESAEDYLEAILRLQERQGQVRSIDIANELGFSKPSVSIAMKKLRESGYIEVNANGSLSLLAPGRTVAERIYTRHRLLARFLESLGVSEANAAADACKIEHDLSEETFDRLREYIEKQKL